MSLHTCCLCSFTSDKSCSFYDITEFACLFQPLIYRDILVYILAADKGIEEDVGQHSHYQPVAGDVADVEGEHIVLDERHDTTTHNEHHEDT